MKTRRAAGGYLTGKTLTVSELRYLLAAYPDDMPVFMEWDPVTAVTNEESIWIVLPREAAP